MSEITVLMFWQKNIEIYVFFEEFVKVVAFEMSPNIVENEAILKTWDE